jgi:hypothetical protein
MAPVLMSMHSADVSMTRCSSAFVRVICNCLTADSHYYSSVTHKQQLRKITVPVSVMSLGILAVEKMTSKPWRSLENFDHDLEGVVW